MAKQYHLSESDIEPIAIGFGSCFASDQITVHGMKVGFMYREQPDPSVVSDSGWRFFSGQEDQEYLDNPGNLALYDVNTIANYDRSIAVHLSAPYGSAFGKSTSGEWMLEPFPNDPDAQQALAERRVQSHARLKRGVGLLKMSRRLAVTALGLAGWTSIAHAHGEEAVLLMLGIVLVILVAPFAAFLFFWRGSFRSKAILCCAYLAALPLAFYAALSAGISNAGSFSSLSSAFHFPFGCREPAT